MKNHKDYKTIQGIITGNKRVIQDFYENNFVYISSYILQNFGNKQDVEDIFQDAMVFMYQKAASKELKIQASLRSYFYGVCKNLWRNKLRQKNTMLFDSLATLSFNHKVYIANTTSVIEVQEKQAIYNKYFQKLSNSSQELLQLFFEGKSMQEISKITGYTKGYTRKKKCESKRYLIKMITQDPIYQELI